MVVDAALRSQSSIAPILLDYCRDRLGIDGLRFAGPLRSSGDSWESYVYVFRLRPQRRIPRSFLGSLILRLHGNNDGVSHFEREIEVQDHMRKMGFPVPETIILEPDTSWFGCPFVINHTLGGSTMLELLLRWYPSLLYAPAAMARAHCDLHRMPAEDFPAPERPFLDRRLDDIARRLKALQEAGSLEAGLEWLTRERPPQPERSSILHLDFHPANLIFIKGHLRGVIDWGFADVGDRHADVATTLLLIDTAPVEHLSWIGATAAQVGRPLLTYLYLHSYRKFLTIDQEKLRYYTALAALYRLAKLTQSVQNVQTKSGGKTKEAEHVTRDVLTVLEAAFTKSTGIAVHVPLRQ